MLLHLHLAIRVLDPTLLRVNFFGTTLTDNDGFAPPSFRSQGRRVARVMQLSHWNGDRATIFFRSSAFVETQRRERE